MRRLLFLSHPHKHQRYDTCGDYIEGHGITLFLISEMGNEQFESCVAVHEFLEYLLVKARGISLDAIDQFDMAFERNRAEGDDSEPGDDPTAPYHAAHVFATKMERLLAEELGVDWDVYDKAVLALSQEK